MESDTTSPSPENTINVVLVDDSSVIRGALSRILKREPSIKIVDTASDGVQGVEAAKEKKPHIVILDIEMPVMDGITALPKILAASPETKVIMFSSLTEKGASITLRAMALGAVECLVKPTSTSVPGADTDFDRRLLTLIKGLVPAPRRTSTGAVQTRSATPGLFGKTYTLRPMSTGYTGKPEIVAIGSSTGGPPALFKVIKSFTGFNVPIVITQHMPATFTKILAEHITQQTGIPAHEAEEGMVLQNGHAYVAKGGYHMLLKHKIIETVIHLDDGPLENFCKPAVDPMLRSVAEIYGKKTLAVILTGMGHDGMEGAKILAAQGARVIAQDEASSIVWGMPGAAAEAGICNAVLPLDQIGPLVRRVVLG